MEGIRPDNLTEPESIRSLAKKLSLERESQSRSFEDTGDFTLPSGSTFTGTQDSNFQTLTVDSTEGFDSSETLNALCDTTAVLRTAVVSQSARLGTLYLLSTVLKLPSTC